MKASRWGSENEKAKKETHRPIENVTEVLSLVRARATRLEFAVLTLEDVPVRSGMAHIAVPDHQRGVRFDHLERMVAGTGAWNCHFAV